MESEVWKCIPGFAGYYEASNMGRIRSIPRQITRKDGVVTTYADYRIRKTHKNPDGYYCVLLTRDGVNYPRKVHRLVAETFCKQEYVTDNEVNHLNCVITDNRACNLAWSSGAMNHLHAILNGRRANKLCESDIRIIRSLRNVCALPLKEIACCFSVTESVISEVANRKAWDWVA